MTGNSIQSYNHITKLELDCFCRTEVVPICFVQAYFSTFTTM